jgi:acyl carrier protein
MMNKKFEEKFLNVIKKNLLVKKRITMEDDVKSFQKWDSLNNIRILVDLNKTFKKNININKIGNIKTLKDLGKYFL